MKALICIQGINDTQGYLYNMVKGEEAFQSYDIILDTETEKHFDAHKGLLFKALSTIGDNLDDIWDFYRNTEARIAVCREARQLIKDTQYKGYEVDIIAHSLGTLIALCCGPNRSKKPVNINKLILMGSPLGVGNLFLRMWTSSHTEKYCSNFKAQDIDYLWSEEDFISCRLTGKIQDLLDRNSQDSRITYHTRTTHSAKEYLDYYLDNVL